MREPKITVVIPTRERCEVLSKSLKTVTNQDYDNLEIIVSDNCSDDETKDVVYSANDPRIRYVNTGRRLSMSHNWEFALSHVVEGWVTIIGDDDGLLPGSTSKVAEIARSTDIQAIRSSVCAYSWPSLTRESFGQLEVPLQSNSEVRECRTWLSKVLNGRAAYPELPMLYNGGYVSMSVLHAMRAKTKFIYLSCVPDVYSAVSISSMINRYMYLHEPLAINGASRHSTGTSYMSNEVKSDRSPAAMFASEGNIPMHDAIPLCADGRYPPSLSALVYESYLQSSGLRSEAPNDSHAHQLEIILATSLGHEDAIREWGRLFAARHELDFNIISSRADRAKAVLNFRSIPNRILAVLDKYYLGSSQCPIKDVFEASVAAAAILDVMPSRLRNLPRLFDRVIGKVTQI